MHHSFYSIFEIFIIKIKVQRIKRYTNYSTLTKPPIFPVLLHSLSHNLFFQHRETSGPSYCLFLPHFFPCPKPPQLLATTQHSCSLVLLLHNPCQTSTKYQSYQLHLGSRLLLEKPSPDQGSPSPLAALCMARYPQSAQHNPLQALFTVHKENRAVSNRHASFQQIHKTPNYNQPPLIWQLSAGKSQLPLILLSSQHLLTTLC